MSILKELYQEIIIDHNRNPRHFEVLDPCDCKAVGHNHLCGDKLVIYARLDGDTIREVSFVGDGCAISRASASLMTDVARGMTRAEFDALYHRFHHTVTSQDAIPDDLGKIEVLTGVREYPARVKCATLAWHTLNEALRGNLHSQTE